MTSAAPRAATQLRTPRPPPRPRARRSRTRDAHPRCGRAARADRMAGADEREERLAGHRRDGRRGARERAGEPAEPHQRTGGASRSRRPRSPRGRSVSASQRKRPPRSIRVGTGRERDFEASSPSSRAKCGRADCQPPAGPRTCGRRRRVMRPWAGNAGAITELANPPSGTRARARGGMAAKLAVQLAERDRSVGEEAGEPPHLGGGAGLVGLACRGVEGEARRGRAPVALAEAHRHRTAGAGELGRRIKPPVRSSARRRKRVTSLGVGGLRRATDRTWNLPSLR